MGSTTWEKETPFNAHWIISLGQLMIFNDGNSIGFDQVRPYVVEDMMDWQSM